MEAVGVDFSEGNGFKSLTRRQRANRSEKRNMFKGHLATINRRTFCIANRLLAAVSVTCIIFPSNASSDSVRNFS